MPENSSSIFGTTRLDTLYLYNRSLVILFKKSIVRSIIYPKTMLNGNIKLFKVVI